MRCRSCHARIVWAVTKNGKRIPFDFEPSEAGTFYLIGGDPPQAIHKHSASPEQAQGRKLYTSHFATCPQASLHRRSS